MICFAASIGGANCTAAKDNRGLSNQSQHNIMLDVDEQL